MVKVNFNRVPISRIRNKSLDPNKGGGVRYTPLRKCEASDAASSKGQFFALSCNVRRITQHKNPPTTMENIICPICVNRFHPTLTATIFTCRDDNHRCCRFCLARMLRAPHAPVCPVCRAQCVLNARHRNDFVRVTCQILCLGPHATDEELRDRAEIAGQLPHLNVAQMHQHFVGLANRRLVVPDADVEDHGPPEAAQNPLHPGGDNVAAPPALPNQQPIPPPPVAPMLPEQQHGGVVEPQQAIIGPLGPQPAPLVRDQQLVYPRHFDNHFVDQEGLDIPDPNPPDYRLPLFARLRRSHRQTWLLYALFAITFFIGLTTMDESWFVFAFLIAVTTFIYASYDQLKRRILYLFGEYTPDEYRPIYGHEDWQEIWFFYTPTEVGTLVVGAEILNLFIREHDFTHVRKVVVHRSLYEGLYRRYVGMIPDSSMMSNMLNYAFPHAETARISREVMENTVAVCYQHLLFNHTQRLRLVTLTTPSRMPRSGFY